MYQINHCLLALHNFIKPNSYDYVCCIPSKIPLTMFVVSVTQGRPVGAPAEEGILAGADFVLAPDQTVADQKVAGQKVHDQKASGLEFSVQKFSC